MYTSTSKIQQIFLYNLLAKHNLQYSSNSTGSLGASGSEEASIIGGLIDTEPV
jgi:hypothetical protein